MLIPPSEQCVADTIVTARFEPLAYASRDTVATGVRSGSVGRIVQRVLRVLPVAAILAAVAWAALLYATAKSGLDEDLPLGFGLKIEDGGFRLDRRGPPLASGDVLLPFVLLLAVPPAVVAGRRVSRTSSAGRTRWGALHDARRPLFSLFVVLAVGAEAIWLRRPERPPETWWPPTEVVFAAESRRLRSADVSADVDAALARGDRRLIGIGGAGGVVPPGLPDYWPRAEWYKETFGMRWVAYTSDCILSPEQGGFHGAAYDYAARYNPVLVARSRTGVWMPTSRPSTVPARRVGPFGI